MNAALHELYMDFAYIHGEMSLLDTKENCRGFKTYLSDNRTILLNALQRYSDLTETEIRNKYVPISDKVSDDVLRGDAAKTNMEIITWAESERACDEEIYDLISDVMKTLQFLMYFLPSKGLKHFTPVHKYLTRRYVKVYDVNEKTKDSTLLILIISGGLSNENVRVFERLKSKFDADWQIEMALDTNETRLKGETRKALEPVKKNMYVKNENVAALVRLLTREGFLEIGG